MNDNGSNSTTCLVVDDEPAILRLVAVVLRDLGCEILMAPDAESALQMVDKDSPDLVISDVKLPGMNGLQLAHQLKSDSRFDHTPVLLMSAFGEPANHDGDGFLAKPFDIDRLVDFVTPFLDPH